MPQPRPASGNERAGSGQSNRYNCVGPALTCIFGDIAGAFDAIIKTLSYGSAGRQAHGRIDRVGGANGDRGSRRWGWSLTVLGSGRPDPFQPNATRVEAGFFGWDVATGKIVCEPGTYRLHGLPADGSATMDTFLSRVPAEDRDHVTEALRLMMGACGSYQFEYRVTGHDGSLRWMEARGPVLPGPDGRRPSSSASSPTRPRSGPRAMPNGAVCTRARSGPPGPTRSPPRSRPR